MTSAGCSALLLRDTRACDDRVPSARLGLLRAPGDLGGFDPGPMPLADAPVVMGEQTSLMGIRVLHG